MKKFLLLLFPLSLLFACGTKAPLVSSAAEETGSAPSITSKAGFTPNGALFTNEKMYQEEWDINNILEETGINNRMVLSRATRKKLTHDSTHYFEIGHYKSMEAGINQYAYLIAWKKLGEEWLKELEVLYPAQNNPSGNPFLIGQARKEWMFLSNDHNPAGLVSEIYAANSVYFNQGKVYQGRESITEKYQYMAKPTWNIELAADDVLAVRDDLFFEMGTYRSSGTGHYVLIWKKQNEDTWQAILDFNF